MRGTRTIHHIMSRLCRSYSSTSSARASSVGGTSMPSAFAEIRFDVQLQLGRLPDRKIGGLRPAQHLAHNISGANFQPL
jgi:hypothetical protein